LQKWSISKCICSIGMHVIKRLMVNYDTPNNIYILTVKIFDIRPRVSLIDLYLHTSFC